MQGWKIIYLGNSTLEIRERSSVLHDNYFFMFSTKYLFFVLLQAKLVPWLDDHQHLSLPVVAVMILHKRVENFSLSLLKLFTCKIFWVTRPTEDDIHISSKRHSHFPQDLETFHQCCWKVKRIFPTQRPPAQMRAKKTS